MRLFEVGTFLGCALVAVVFAAAALLADRHGWWLSLVAATTAGAALGFGVHVAAVQIDRVT